jgi:hypothetical protein
MISLKSVDVTIRIANGKTLSNELRNLVAMASPPEQVYITDIPLLTDHAAEVLLALKALARKRIRVHLYDHHHGWDAVAGVKAACATYCVDTSKTTAAAIVWRERCRGDKASQEWLRLLSEKSDSKDPDIVDRFGLLAAIMQPKNYKHTEGVLKALARGGDMLPEHRELSRWYYAEHVEREKKLAAGAQVLVAKSGLRVGWIDLRQEEGHLLVSRLVVELLHVDVVGTVIRNAVLLGGSSIDQGLDLTFLHGAHTVGGVQLSVAGHKSPVRISAVGEGVDDDAFVAAVKGLVLARM